ncbi:MAG: acetylglutamate kinase [Succinivibrionaceae bacterium]|nr:acetylglutamate kinase [Succinivibrionaceae bacterium]
MGAPQVIKLSGKALRDTKALRGLLALAAQGCDHPPVLVHGGGVEVDEILTAMGFAVERRDGLRVSPREQMPYITAALAGMCSRGLQALAEGEGLRCVGLLCTDCGIATVEPLEGLGMVGSAAPGDPSLLNYLTATGITPIVCSVGILRGEAYNINADDAARAVAIAMGAPLTFISDVPGVLDAGGLPIPRIDAATAAALQADGTISGGMAVKIRAALETSRRTGRPVRIASLAGDGAASRLLGGLDLGTAVIGY